MRKGEESVEESVMQRRSRRWQPRRWIDGLHERKNVGNESDGG